MIELAEITKPILLDETGREIKGAIEQLAGVMANLNVKDGYTPIRGIDYYTEADKAEMVNAVLEALPAAEGVSY